MVDWRNPPPDFLPGVLAEIARRVGVPAALKVAAHWSGRRHIRAVIGRDHELAKLVGHKPAQLIADILRQDHQDGRVVIPSASTQRRWLAIARMYAGQGMTSGQIARKVNLAHRHVERICAGIERGPAFALHGDDHDHGRDDAACAWCGHRPARPRRGSPPPAESKQLDMFPARG